MKTFSIVVVISYLAGSVMLLFVDMQEKIYPLSLVVALSLIFLNLDRFESFKIPFLAAKLKASLEEAHASKEEFDRLSEEMTKKIKDLETQIGAAKAMALAF